MAKGINSLIFFDFETGGLDPRKNAITQLAAVAMKGDTLTNIDMMSVYVKPYGDFVGANYIAEPGKYYYEDEALKYTGTTYDELLGGVDLKETAGQFIELLAKANLYPKNKGSKPVLVAHNGEFDKGFAIQLCKEAGKLKELEKLTYGTTDFYGNYQPYVLDSIILSKMMWGHDEDMTSYKLGLCVAKAGIELTDGHIAINDTIGLKDMVNVMINKMRSEGEAGEAIVKNSFRKHFQM